MCGYAGVHDRHRQNTVLETADSVPLFHESLVFRFVVPPRPFAFLDSVFVLACYANTEPIRTCSGLIDASYLGAPSYIARVESRDDIGQLGYNSYPN